MNKKTESGVFQEYICEFQKGEKNKIVQVYLKRDYLFFDLHLCDAKKN
jgi:hypothetical protein